MDRQERAAALDVRYLLHGQLVSRALCAVAALGIPDLLTAGPLSPAELARRTGADPSRLRQLIAALVPFEVFTIRPDGEVELARLGRALTTDAAGSALAGAQLAHDLMSQAWQGLPETVRTGVPAFDRAFGGDLFTHLDRDPGLRTVFDRSQANDLELEVDAILRSGDFGTTGTVVDVGGGDGTLLVHLLAAHPGLRGVLVDRPIAVAAARGRLAAAGLAERAEATPGDFFKTLPARGDVYFMREVLHDWDDDQCVTILRTCRQAMPAAARLLVVELASDETPGTGPEARMTGLMSLYMLAVLPGRERCPADYARMMAAAGLRVQSITHLTGQKVLIEASAETPGPPPRG
ncbi:methyltransferase [Streptomyces sp. NBC_01190]|uniref:methyltransferase n=1 Tax=Streptomyces sp. NBC_01190 TaxID=2903767 RepID=UPI003865ABAA|nr:acetylserotonin O-methyltransferase [Streptomyces sp. NBC_01190]